MYDTTRISRLIKHGLLVLVVTILSACSSEFDNIEAQNGDNLVPVIIAFTTSTISIINGQSVSMLATFRNGTAVVDNGIGAVTSGQTITVSPSTSTTYTLKVTNSKGVEVSRATTISVSINASLAPRIASFVATPSTINPGTSVSLVPLFSNGTAVINNGIGQVSSGPTIRVSPSLTTTYTLTVTNSAGQNISSQVVVSVNVSTPTITSFVATPATINPGQSTKLVAMFPNGTAEIDNGIGAVISGQEITVTPSIATTYTLTLRNTAGGVASQNITVNINVPLPLISSFTATANSVDFGTSVNLVAMFSSGTATIDNGIGIVTSGQSISVTPASNTTYTLTVSNVNNISVNQQVSIAVVVPPPLIASFVAKPSRINVGSSATLLAQFSDGTAMIDNSVGIVNAGQSVTVTPRMTTNYRLTVTNAAGINVTQALTVTVIAGPQPQITSFDTDSATIDPGGSTNLVAVFSNGLGVIDHGIGSVASGDTVSVSPRKTTTYTLSVTDSLGQIAIKHKTVTNTATVMTSGLGVDGAVNSVVQAADGSIFAGGQFSRVGTFITNGISLDSTSGATLTQIPSMVNYDSSGQESGTVRSAVSDGDGGWYLGGSFNKVGGFVRNNLAHILGDATVDPKWNPNVNFTVNTLVLDKQTIYAGGEFTAVNLDTNRITRMGAAAFNTIDGSVTAWNPDINVVDQSATVHTIAVDGAAVYIGGNFTTVNTSRNSSTRNYLASFDKSTGDVSTWNPNLDARVYTLLLNNNTVYAGGTFTLVNGLDTRIGLAAFNLPTGTLTAWDPNISGSSQRVEDMLMLNNTLYVVGNFCDVNGGLVIRHHAAAFNVSDATASNWDPHLTASPNVCGTRYANSIATDGSTIFVGGDFTDVNGSTTRVDRIHIAAVNSSDGSVTDLVTNITDGSKASVQTLEFDGTRLFAGGSYSLFDVTNVGGIFKLDSNGDLVTSFNPGIGNGVINSMLLQEGELYVGGVFSTVNDGAVTRQHLAAFDTNTGIATRWNPFVSLTGDITGLNTSVNTLTTDGASIYAGGRFSHANKTLEVRNNIAAFNMTDGTVESWNPDIDNTVHTILLDNNTAYIGGNFTSVNQSTTPSLRNYVAAVSTIDGVATAWNPDASFTVYRLVTDGNTIFAGGDFSSVNGNMPRSGLASFDMIDGITTSWDPFVDSRVVALALDNGVVYVGGWFRNTTKQFDGTPRNNLAAFDATTGLVNNWNPDLGPASNTPTLSFIVNNNDIIIGGAFFGINAGTEPRRGIAVVNKTDGALIQ